jgi:hypothetical protein
MSAPPLRAVPVEARGASGSRRAMASRFPLRIRRANRAALLTLAVATLSAVLVSRFVTGPVEIALESQFGDLPTALGWSADDALFVGGKSGAVAVFDRRGVRRNSALAPTSQIKLGAVGGIFPAPAGDDSGRKATFLYLRADADADPLGFVRWLDTPTASSDTKEPLTLSFTAPNRLLAVADRGVVVAGSREPASNAGRASPVTRIRVAAGALGGSNSASDGANPAQFPVAKERSVENAFTIPDSGGELVFLASLPRLNAVVAVTDRRKLYFLPLLNPLNSADQVVPFDDPAAPAEPVTALAARSSFGDAKAVMPNLAVASANGSLTLLRVKREPNVGASELVNVATLRLGGPDQALPIDAVQLSADGGAVLARSRDGALYVVFVGGEDIPSVSEPKRLQLPPVLSAELSPEGTRVVTVDASDIIRVYALERPTAVVTELAQIHGHGDVVHLMALSPDGRYLASASLDGRLRLTDLDAAIRYARLPLYSVLSAPPPQPMRTFGAIAPMPAAGPSAK